MRPPDFALAQARAAGIDLSLLVEACDAGEQQDKCCAAKRSPEKAGCCTERQVATNANQFNGDADVNHIIGWRAMACRGQAIHWLAAVPTLIMPPHALLNDPPLVERCAPAVSEVAGGVPDAPDVPPPEVSSLA